MYILESKMKAVDYSTEVISQIEDKFKNKEAVTENEIDVLLEYICYKTRLSLSDNLYGDTFDNKDLEAASIIYHYLNSLNIEAQVLNTKASIDYGVTNNNFVVAKIKTYLYGEDLVLYYLLDPTFKQFCKFDKCKESNFKEKNGIIYEKPGIPYYISSFDAEFILDFIYFGYMYLDTDAAEVYGNAFLNTKVPVKAKKDEFVTLSGDEFFDKFTEKYDTKIYSKESLEKKGLLIEPIKPKLKELK